MAVRHRNIPVFIPHLGCPHACVFCNQRTISGKQSFDRESVNGVIEQALSTLSPEDEAEIAFFGGSFTGIDRGDMIYLLDTAKRYVDAGRVVSIRLSTRPDYIDGEILGILSRYPVRHIELGIQSLSDRVLAASERGHTAAQAIAACHMVKDSGFELVGQMMTGLPLSNIEDEVMTAAGICDAGADAARIYPTVVLRGTKLAEMSENGDYIPPDEEETVRRAADALEVFAARNVPVIRIGLCASEGLDASVSAGKFHAAVGELAEGELYYRRICAALDALPYIKEGVEIRIYCPRGCVSKVAGQNKRNKLRVMCKYKVKCVKIIETDTISGYNIEISLD